MSADNNTLPREFGKYHLIELVATGGMAELYRAKLYGAGGFEKDLAIKKILPTLAKDSSFTQMFMDEAMITVTLNHGNIVSVMDFGQINNEYFLVMEYIDGVDLQNLILKSTQSASPIPIDIAVYIAIQICNGLAYAHRKVGSDGQPLGIIHRDVSPQNILLSFEGEVKIVDFGIARAASRITSTQAGVVKGKVSYMSPEQITGQQLDNRSDIFAIGVMLYEMLTNRLPFEGETPQQSMALVTRGDYEKPQKINKKIDKQLAAVIKKALEKNPKKRYATANKMAEALSGCLHKLGLHPDATKLEDFIPQRIPDAKPRTATPTPRPVSSPACPEPKPVVQTSDPEEEQSLAQVATSGLETDNILLSEVSRILTSEHEVLAESKKEEDFWQEQIRQAEEQQENVIDKETVQQQEQPQTPEPKEQPASPTPPPAESSEQVIQQSPKKKNPVMILAIFGILAIIVGVVLLLMPQEENSPEPTPTPKEKIEVVKTESVARKTVKTAIVEEIPSAAKKEPQTKDHEQISKNLKTGTLKISSKPRSIVFRGKKRIGPTPQKKIELPVGRHTLTLRNKALGLSKKVKVRIKPNKHHTLFVDLTK
jgi:serine/threonine protein kinase